MPSDIPSIPETTTRAFLQDWCPVPEVFYRRFSRICDQLRLSGGERRLILHIFERWISFGDDSVPIPCKLLREAAKGNGYGERRDTAKHLIELGLIEITREHIHSGVKGEGRCREYGLTAQIAKQLEDLYLDCSDRGRRLVNAHSGEPIKTSKYLSELSCDFPEGTVGEQAYRIVSEGAVRINTRSARKYLQDRKNQLRSLTKGTLSTTEYSLLRDEFFPDCGSVSGLTARIVKKLRSECARGHSFLDRIRILGPETSEKKGILSIRFGYTSNGPGRIYSSLIQQTSRPFRAALFQGSGYTDWDIEQCHLNVLLNILIDAQRRGLNPPAECLEFMKKITTSREIRENLMRDLKIPKRAAKALIYGIANGGRPENGKSCIRKDLEKYICQARIDEVCHRAVKALAPLREAPNWIVRQVRAGGSVGDWFQVSEGVVTNHSEKTKPLRKNKENEILAHILQGVEATEVARMTVALDQAGVKVIANFHDGLILSGDPSQIQEVLRSSIFKWERNLGFEDDSHNTSLAISPTASSSIISDPSSPARLSNISLPFTRELDIDVTLYYIRTSSLQGLIIGGIITESYTSTRCRFSLQGSLKRSCRPPPNRDVRAPSKINRVSVRLSESRRVRVCLDPC